MPPIDQYRPQNLPQGDDHQAVPSGNPVPPGALSPAAARELLAAADTASAHGDTISGRAWLGPTISVFLAVLLGAFLLAGVYVLPVATAPEAALISGGYAVGVVLAVTAYNLGRKVVTRGWLTRYTRGVAISSGVFFVSLALSFLIDERSLALWVPLAIATALPLIILGTRRSSAPRSAVDRSAA